MFERLLLFLRGSLCIQIIGINPERFLSLCAGAGLTFRKLGRTEAGYEGWLSLPDYRLSLPLAKKSRTLLHIREKRGLPFWLYRNRDRKAYVAGLLAALGLWFWASLFLWDIQVSGNTYYTDDVLISFLREQGVRHGQPMADLVCEELEQAIRLEYPHITWVSAQISGTRLLLQVKENLSPLRIEAETAAPCHLVAMADGVITSIVTRSGEPQVKAGDPVTAGQVLVSGLLPVHDDAGEVASWNEVTADADILGLTAIPYEWQRSCFQETRETLRSLPCGLWLRLGGRQLTLGRSSSKEAGHYTLTEPHCLRVFYNRSFPFSWGLTWDHAYQTRVRRLTEAELAAEAERAMAEYQRQLLAQGISVRESALRVQQTPFFYRVSGTLTVECALARPLPLAEMEPSDTNLP